MCEGANHDQDWTVPADGDEVQGVAVREDKLRPQQTEGQSQVDFSLHKPESVIFGKSDQS